MARQPKVIDVSRAFARQARGYEAVRNTLAKPTLHFLEANPDVKRLPGRVSPADLAAYLPHLYDNVRPEAWAAYTGTAIERGQVLNVALTEEYKKDLRKNDMAAVFGDVIGSEYIAGTSKDIAAFSSTKYIPQRYTDFIASECDLDMSFLSFSVYKRLSYIILNYNKATIPPDDLSDNKTTGRAAKRTPMIRGRRAKQYKVSMPFDLAVQIQSAADDKGISFSREVVERLRNTDGSDDPAP